jgi:hypothetical protein
LELKDNFDVLGNKMFKQRYKTLQKKRLREVKSVELHYAIILVNEDVAVKNLNYKIY